MEEFQIQISEGEKIYNPGKQNQVIALQNINLSIHKGDALCIIGVSGSGKTTLLNVIACIDSLSKGIYHFEGKDVASLSDKELSRLRSDHFGYILQEYGLLLKDKVSDNVMLPLYFSTKFQTLKAKKLRVKECLHSVMMEDKIKEKVIALSGGQKQRVAIARALANDPDVIIADEPTGALDSKTKQEIMDVLLGLNKKGKTLITVTHDEAVASRFERVIRIVDGGLIENGKTKNK